MQMPSDRWVEIASGLGASGVHMLLAWRYKGMPSPAGHPMVPMLTIALEEEEGGCASAVPYADVMLRPSDGAVEWSKAVLERVQSLASGEYTPLCFEYANVDFQIARGAAVSL